MIPPAFRVTVERLVADPALPDFSLRQLAMLMIVREAAKADCTIRGIAARLAVCKPAITRAADRLQEMGLITRQVDRADRRSVFIRLTPAGHKLLARLSTLPEDLGAAA